MLAHVSTEDHAITLRELKSGKVLRRLKGHHDTPRVVSFSEDGNVIASCGDSSCRIWDLRSNHSLIPGSAWVHSDASIITWCDVSPDAKRFVYVTEDSRLYSGNIGSEPELVYEFGSAFRVRGVGVGTFQNYLQWFPDASGFVVLHVSVFYTFMVSGERHEHKLPESVVLSTWRLGGPKGRTLEVLAYDKKPVPVVKNGKSDQGEASLARVLLFSASSKSDGFESPVVLSSFGTPIRFCRFNATRDGVVVLSGDMAYVIDPESERVLVSFEAKKAFPRLSYLGTTARNEYVLVTEKSTVHVIPLATINGSAPLEHTMSLFGHTSDVSEYQVSAGNETLVTVSDDSLMCWKLDSVRVRPRVADAWIALLNGNGAQIKTMLDSKFCRGLVNEPDEDGNTLMHYACRHRRPDLVRLLLSHPERNSFRAFLPNKSGQTPLDTCIAHHSRQSLAVLLESVSQNIPLHNMGAVSAVLVPLCEQYPSLVLNLFNSLGMPQAHPEVQEGQEYLPAEFELGCVRMGAATSRPSGAWKKKLGSSCSRHDTSSSSSSSSSSSASSVPPSGSSDDVSLEKGGAPTGDTDEHGRVRRVSTMKGTWKDVVDLRDSERETRGTSAVAIVCPLPYLTSYWTEDLTEDTNAISVMYENGLADLLGTPMMKHVIEFKWDMYGRFFFIRQLVLYLLYLCLFTVMTTADVAATSWYAEEISILFVFLTSLYYVGHEVRQVVYDGWHYFVDPWNYFELSGYSLALAASTLRYAGDSNSVRVLRSVEAVAAVILWFKTLSFARGFRSTGPFIRMIFKVSYAIRFFILVLIVVIIGFSHGFHLLYVGIPESDVDEENVGQLRDFRGWSVILEMYRMIFGELPTDIMPAAREPAIAYMLMICYTVFVSIIMLNLLIAFMTDVYDLIQRNVENEWMLERTKILLEIEPFLPASLRDSPEYFPRWLHVLQPQESKKPEAIRNADLLTQNLALEARVMELSNAVAAGQASLQQQLSSVEQRISTLDSRLAVDVDEPLDEGEVDGH